jgi:hypothetical protein
MASSAQTPFNDHVIEIDGVKYVKHSFYMDVMDMNSEFVDELRKQNQKLKQKINKLEQRVK